MATQGDRAELRAEAHYFAEALKKASDEGDTKEKSVYWRRAGHPLFVVVLGGILATLIAASLQRQHFLEQQSLIQQQQFQEKRYKLLADFSEPFRKYMTILYNIRTLQEFFRCVQVPSCADERQGKDFLGRTPAEAKLLYAKMVDELFKAQRGEAVLVSVRALFSSKPVLDVLDQMHAKVRILQEKEILSGKEIKDLDSEVEVLWLQLASAMRNEVIADQKKLPMASR